MDTEQEHLWSVGEVCQRYHITRKTLFYYDRTDLLKPADRQGSQQFKMYGIHEITRLKTILRYREAGLSIEEIKQILDHPDRNHCSLLKDVLSRLEQEKQQKQDEIQHLQKLIQQEEQRLKVTG